MKVILRADALELDAKTIGEDANFSEPHEVWRESLRVMLDQGGEFEVDTTTLFPDKFYVFRRNDILIEIPEYLVEQVIDDIRKEK